MAVVRAKELRKESTNAEEVMWRAIRDRRLSDCKFRRQHPIGKYILDFFSYEVKLAIELDGSVHEGTESEDSWREKVIASRGIRFLRFKNDEVEYNLPSVLAQIINVIDEQVIDRAERVCIAADRAVHERPFALGVALFPARGFAASRVFGVAHAPPTLEERCKCGKC